MFLGYEMKNSLQKYNSKRDTKIPIRINIYEKGGNTVISVYLHSF